MAETGKDLGKLVSIHGISAAVMQRAIFITVLSFLFFLTMMLAFYIRQSIGYFLLATAFLLVYLVTLASWVLQRKNVVKTFENGLTYKKSSVRWDEIKAVSPDGEIVVSDTEKIMLPKTIVDYGALITKIRANAHL